ncbi:EpsG family protein [Chryseobacterium tongliaoense]|uniref:EpsG family protein n=1 Tax=Chryseobacterium tongliaoense TaxID=3240933 RepID=UPI003516427C
MTLLIILCVILFYIGQLIEQLPSKFVAYIFNATLFFVVTYCFLDFTYTADWDMYYYFFKHEDDKTDPIFYWLTLSFKKLYLTYTDLYKFHIVLIISLYYFLISRFTKNIFFIFLAYLILDNVHLVNQIRYYLGFPILMTGFYFLFYHKKYLLSLILITVALLCHSGLSFLLICIPVYYFIPVNKFYKYIIILSGLIFVIALFIFNSALGTVLNHFGDYFEKGNKSSFLGGLYNGIPYILFTVFLYIQTISLIREKPEIIEDPQFKFLYKISFFAMIFIPGSFIIQIIGHRYVMTLSVFWLLYYYIYFLKDQAPKRKLTRFIYITGIVFVSGLFIYIIPNYIFGNSHFAEEFQDMIESSDILKGFLE